MTGVYWSDSIRLPSCLSGTTQVVQSRVGSVETVVGAALAKEVRRGHRLTVVICRVVGDVSRVETTTGKGHLRTRQKPG